MRSIEVKILICVLLICIVPKLEAQLTPQEAIIQMGRGINVGNSLDATPTETSWGNAPIQEYYFDDIKAAGFSCVRIPVTWKFHTSISSPYSIDSIWLNRVDSVVTWALKKKLFVTINAHHEDGLKAVNSMADPLARADTLAKYDSIWSQVAYCFKDRSDSLLFEILNEPHDMQQTTLDSLNTRILSIIRKHNPTRIVLFSGTANAGANDLIKASVPDTTDKYLMAYYHSYDPWPFAGEAKGTFGSTSNITESDNRFKMVSQWAASNNLPVTLNECGAVKNCDYNSRMIYYATYVEQALKYNIAINFWDDNGDFQLYDRINRKWDEFKDVIIYTYPESPTKLSYEIIDSSAILSWVNRTDVNDSIVVEKRSANGFDTLEVVAPDADSIYLPNLEKDVFHYFRLKTTLHDTLMYSYAIRFKISTVTGIFNKPASHTENILKIYPNPARDLLYIRTKIVIPGANLSVYNSQGQRIATSPLMQNETIMNVFGYPKGVYYIQVEKDERVIYPNSKFIIN